MNVLDSALKAEMMNECYESRLLNIRKQNQFKLIQIIRMRLGVLGFWGEREIVR